MKTSEIIGPISWLLCPQFNKINSRLVFLKPRNLHNDNDNNNSNKSNNNGSNSSNKSNKSNNNESNNANNLENENDNCVDNSVNNSMIGNELSICPNSDLSMRRLVRPGSYMISN
mmetsp:Transcript_11239/g.1743  ORF Transcript_11239/g.1743 Transcript_11239/m.1743 type:complete len:115 (-) Transcript_11239:173-517(-)